MYLPASPANAQISVTSTGNLASFTPTTAGTFTVYVQATDAAFGVGRANCTVVIKPAPTPTCPETSPGVPLTVGHENVALPPATSSFTGGTAGTGSFSVQSPSPASLQYAFSGSVFQGTQTNLGQTTPVNFTYVVRVVVSVMGV